MLEDYKLTILGTAAAKPTADRNVSAHAVHVGRETVLFDCGEGVTLSLLKNHINVNSIKRIFITHCHIDHIGGLIGLLNAMNLHGRREKLDIYGPKDLRKVIKRGIRMTNVKFDFEYVIHTVKPNFVPKVTLSGYEFSGEYVKNAYVDVPKYRISVAKADHRVETYAYRLDLNGKPGKFDAVKADKLGVYGADRSKLIAGKTITVNKKTIYPSDLVGETRPGKSFGYSGDTKPTDHLQYFFKNVSCLLFDATYTLADRDKAINHGHSNTFQVGRLAKAAHADHLILTHFSAIYKDTDDHLKEAKYSHPNVTCAVDYLTVHVKY